MEQLKPCPFCGGKASIAERTNKNWGTVLRDFWVECNTCYARTEMYTDIVERTEKGEFIATDGKQKSIDVWNTRVKE